MAPRKRWPGPSFPFPLVRAPHTASCSASGEAQSCYPHLAAASLLSCAAGASCLPNLPRRLNTSVWGLCSAGCKTTDSGKTWRRAGAGAEEFVPPASLPKPRPRSIAPGHCSVAEYPCTPAHHTKQSAVCPQSGPSRWSSCVSGNLRRNGNARRCPRTTPVRETISLLCGEDERRRSRKRKRCDKMTPYSLSLLFPLPS